VVLNVVVVVIIITTISEIYSKENKSNLECNYACGTTHEVGKNTLLCRGG
jgi:hypothetical protein